ncbi:hypothetical protein SAMN05216343_10155 [Oscillibacter sp. PC13]|uniref:hypothetical protein n=1 Tax=Oscillibacter sp. PC13 TaxID=1855299 RepID=UPI0008EE81E4|nr:hypothetical protein [Oscillibacter sp. PC13]SFO93945.1 hypothetical protein SAMN05216343_10155 [Oscillibacter sp. PC13]
MTNADTVKLLQECDAGSKMAVSAIDEVLDKTQDSKLNELLTESKQHHTKLGNEIHSLLEQHGSDDKDPNPMAKGMSWLKTNWKMGVDESDATIADLMTDGCNMGVKSLNKYLNQYPAADEKSKNICKQLIAIEEQLGESLKNYL